MKFVDDDDDDDDNDDGRTVRPHEIANIMQYLHHSDIYRTYTCRTYTCSRTNALLTGVCTCACTGTEAARYTGCKSPCDSACMRKLWCCRRCWCCCRCCSGCQWNNCTRSTERSTSKRVYDRAAIGCWILISIVIPYLQKNPWKSPHNPRTHETGEPVSFLVITVKINLKAHFWWRHSNIGFTPCLKHFRWISSIQKKLKISISQWGLIKVPIPIPLGIPAPTVALTACIHEQSHTLYASIVTPADARHLCDSWAFCFVT